MRVPLAKDTEVSALLPIDFYSAVHPVSQSGGLQVVGTRKVLCHRPSLTNGFKTPSSKMNFTILKALSRSF